MAEESKNQTSDSNANLSDVAFQESEMTTLHERTIASMSYFGFLAIVPFYLKKDSKFCRFHGKQGLLLAIIFFIARLFSVLDIIMDIVLSAQVLLMFYMSLSALSGKWKRLPFLYDWSCQLETTLSLDLKKEEKKDESF